MTMKIIDMHSHWGTPRGLGTDLLTEVELKGQALAWNGELKTVTEAEMAEQFRKSGVRAILDLGFRFGQPPEVMSSLFDYAIDTQKQYSDVILGNWLHIDPHRGDAVKELRRCIDRKGDGFVGLGVSGAGLNIAASDPVYEPLYALCEEAGIPILVLVGTTALGVGVPGGAGVQIDFSHPRHLDQVAATHPGLSILAGRPGWPWQTETIAVLLHKRNVYYEVHGWSPKYFTEDLKREISRRLKGRILFGADYPMLKHERLTNEWRDEGYESDVLDGVFHGNAEAFLSGLKGYKFKHVE